MQWMAAQSIQDNSGSLLSDSVEAAQRGNQKKDKEKLIKPEVTKLASILKRKIRHDPEQSAQK